jgi:hypothetical protein
MVQIDRPPKIRALPKPRFQALLPKKLLDILSGESEAVDGAVKPLCLPAAPALVFIHMRHIATLQNSMGLELRP